VTLKEIAAKVGVHVSTVSRVINSPDDNFGSREVRERIWTVVRESGYVPNPSAQALRQSRIHQLSHRIGTLDCVLGRTKYLEDNPFFAQVARAAEQQALNMGYSVQVSYSVMDPAQWNTKAREEPPIGAVVLGWFDKPEIIQLLESRYKNLVFVGRNLIGANWDQVICDGYEAAVIALNHLIGYGHCRIGYIGETKNDARYRAFVDIVKKHNLEFSPDLVASCNHNNSEGGYQGVKKLLEKAKPLPTAVFCASDVVAIATMRRFRESRVKIPTQLSIVSLDNIELSGYVSPMLTTVGMPIVEMGSVAVQVLVSRINKLHRLPQKIFLPNKLADRESVTNLNEGMYI